MQRRIGCFAPLLCATQMMQMTAELVDLAQRCSCSSSLLKQMLAAAATLAAACSRRLLCQWGVVEALDHQQQMPQQPRCSCLRALLLQLAY
jgi:hypothetical protein